MSSIEGAFGIIGCGGTQDAGLDFCTTCNDCVGGVVLGFRFFFLLFFGDLCQNGFIAAPLSAFLRQTDSCDALVQISSNPNLNARSKLSIDAADSPRLSREPEIV